MNNKQQLDLTSPMCREKALNLLYDNEIKESSNKVYFDEYGNYIFHTDLVTSTPNTATGTSAGLCFIDQF